MEYTLHKLKEGFSITSDEKIKAGDKILYRLTNKIFIWDGKTPSRHEDLKVIAQQNQIDFSALKEEERKKIGWFDVEKFALDSYNKSYPNYEPVTDYKLVEKYRSVEQFNNGFQKAQELLSDGRFTLEDLRETFKKGMRYVGSSSTHTIQLESGKEFEERFNKCIQSLSKPKSWKVELEMEDSFRANEETYIDDSGVKGNYSTHSKKPKLTNGKIKITKIL